MKAFTWTLAIAMSMRVFVAGLISANTCRR